MTDPNIDNKIQSIQDQYYQENTKNRFFKKSQKIDCANKVLNEVGMNELIERTVYYKEGTNMLMLNYPVFKTFATDEVCGPLTDYFIELLKYGKKYYNSIDLRIDFDTLTITGFERYKNFIKMSMSKISNKYDHVIKTCTIVNAPSFTGQIISLFASIIGPTEFTDLQTKLYVISKK